MTGDRHVRSLWEPGGEIPPGHPAVRAARVHGAHSGSGLYRDSLVLRHAGHSRACAMISLLTGGCQAKHAGRQPTIPMCHHPATARR